MHRVGAKRIRAKKTIAADQYKVFHGVGVVIAEVKSDTHFSVIAVLDGETKVDFTKTERRFPVDMTLTPKRCGSANWHSVAIDDRGVNKDGVELPPTTDFLELQIGVTSIGSGSIDDPPLGAFVGAVYLEHTLYEALRSKKFPGWPDDYFMRSQLTTIAYSPADGSARRGKRYHGFLATVIEVFSDHVRVSFDDQPDSSSKPVTLSIVPNDANTYDDNPPAEAFDGEVSLASKLTKGASGALFVELQTAVAIGLLDAKIPVGFGE